MTTSTSACALVGLLAACGNSDAVDDEIADQIQHEFAEDDELTLVAQTGSLLRAFSVEEVALSGIALNTVVRVDTQNLAFGVVIAHLRANAQLDEVMRVYGVGLLSTQAEAMLVAEARAGAEQLRVTPPEQMDAVFLEIQIRLHLTADAVLEALERKNESGAMADHLTGFHAMTSDHLERAEQIFDDLE